MVRNMDTTIFTGLGGGFGVWSFGGRVLGFGAYTALALAWPDQCYDILDLGFKPLTL